MAGPAHREQTLTARDVVLVGTFAGLIVVLGIMPAIPIGIMPVPITLQTAGVMLAGAHLGAMRGGLAALVVVILAAVGLPVLAGGRGGFSVLAGPTAGFLLGWIPGAFVTGLITDRLAPTSRALAVAWTFLACVVGGVGMVYACGIAWLSAVSGVQLRVAALGSLAFLPGDLIKSGIAAWISVEVRRNSPVPRR